MCIETLALDQFHAHWSSARFALIASFLPPPAAPEAPLPPLDHYVIPSQTPESRDTQAVGSDC